MGQGATEADPFSVWMGHLERAHALAHDAARDIADESEPNEHLEPAARQLERGVAALYDAFDGRADRPTAIGSAHARFWGAAILVARGGQVRALSALKAACEELVRSEAQMPRGPIAPPVATKILASSVSAPLHLVVRPSVVPVFSAPPVPAIPVAIPEPERPAPTTFEELREIAVAMQARALAEAPVPRAPRREPAAKKPVEEPPAGFAYVPDPAITEDDFVRRWARTCFEEVGMIGLQRSPLPGDDWRACVELERRMFSSLDALAVLGPVGIAHCERLALDAPAANPMAIFAIAMVGGCLQGRDVLGGAERALHRFGAGDLAVAESFAGAMKLAPNPYVKGLLLQLLKSKLGAERAVAVEVLAYRGWLDGDELEALSSDADARVVAKVLPALAIARHRDLGAILARGIEHADARVRTAALDAMALGADREAAAAARAEAGGKLGDRALGALAIVADENDARWLLDRMKAKPTPLAIEAVGWAGLLDAVPLLIGLLESGEDEAKIAAGGALYRLLGANLIEDVEIFAEELPDPLLKNPDPEPERKPLAELVSDPRFLPPPPAKETLELPSIDPAKWKAYWAQHGKGLDPKHRHRRGHAYSTSVSLWELDKLPLLADDRRRLHRELAARTGKITHFDPHDFVVDQEASLGAWGGILKGTKAIPGAWGRPGVMK